MGETVLVTGGSGFIAGWVIVDLLKRGYDVRATVRSAAKEASVRAAAAKGGAPTDRLAFAVADLTGDAGWEAAVQGCTFVQHVASPLGQGSEKDKDALVKPAVDGTLRVLRAAVKAGVKRVVLTSSCAAVTPETIGADTSSDETTWSNPEKQDPYRRSKTLAEKAAWDFMKAEGGATELTTILPSAVFGPVLSKEGLGSVQFIQRLVDGRLPRIPNVGLNIIDVRDLAAAHVDAMLAPQAAGERFIINGDFMWMKDVAATLRSRLPPEAATKVPTKPLPDLVVKLGAGFSPALNTLKPLLHRSHRFLSDKARRLIGLKTRPAPDTVVETAQSLLA